MNELDKAICKMIANYLDKAIEAMTQLSEEGDQTLSAVISDEGLPHDGDLSALVTNLKKLAK